MGFSNTLKVAFIPSVKSCRRAKAFSHRWLTVYSIGLILSQLVLGISYYSSPTIVTENPETMAKNIITLTNDERSKSELEALKENQNLDNAAKAKLNDMFTVGYWDHFSPTGKKPWDFIKENNYDYIYAGENLAKGFLDSTSTVNAWMNSPSHKDNLLSARYKEIGVAVGSGKLNGKPTTLVVQMFGAPQVTQLAAVPQQNNAMVLGVKQNEVKFNPMNATIPARIPYFLIWFIIFSLIVFDGAMLRRCGLHTSKKHLFEFRSALLINALALMLLFVNIVTIS